MTADTLAATRTAFLRDICTNPHDDAARLIYADWLTDRDQPGDAERAEFIRVQCELEPLRKHGHGSANPSGGDCPVCLRVAQLERLEKEFLGGGHDYDWFVPRGAFAYYAKWEYRRGFVETLRCSCRDWLRHGSVLVTSHPILKCHFTDWPQPESRLASNPDGSPVWVDNVNYRLLIRSAFLLLGGEVDPWRWRDMGHRLMRCVSHAVKNKGFRSYQDGLDAVATACVNWARDEAGLPPLLEGA